MCHSLDGGIDSLKAVLKLVIVVGSFVLLARLELKIMVLVTGVYMATLMIGFSEMHLRNCLPLEVAVSDLATSSICSYGDPRIYTCCEIHCLCLPQRTWLALGQLVIKMVPLGSTIPRIRSRKMEGCSQVAGQTRPRPPAKSPPPQIGCSQLPVVLHPEFRVRVAEEIGLEF